MLLPQPLRLLRLPRLGRAGAGYEFPDSKDDHDHVVAAFCKEKPWERAPSLEEDLNMKTLKFSLAAALAGLLALLLGCGKSNTATALVQTATVRRGNLSVATTTAGNLDFIHTEDDAFSAAGTVTAVNVQVGDSVKAGEVLATLDTTAYQDQITALQRTLAAKQQGVIQAESSLKDAQIALDNTMNAVPATDAATAQATVDSDTAYLQYAQSNAATASANDQASWQNVVTLAQSQLKSDENALNALLTNANSDPVQLAEMQVQLATSQLQSAQNAVDDAQHAIDEANTGSPNVTCSFDGVVTAVDVTAGTQIYKGQVAATIADPTQFEVVVPVGEKDALSLKIGGAATVSVNALNGVTLPATIIAIAPTATIQSGVVNYNITVQVTSFTPISGQVGSNQTLSGGGASSGTQSGQNQTGGPGSGAPSTTVQPVKVVQGLSVTVSLVTAQVTNVLMVPNRAVIRQSAKTYVNVIKNGVDTQVAVTTGISNTQFTQVISGLNEGDTVIIPTSTVVAPTTTPRPGGGGGIRIFGGG